MKSWAVFLVVALLLDCTEVSAQAPADSELEQLRALLQQQQALIESLQADQRRQQQEIEALKERLGASQATARIAAPASTPGPTEPAATGEATVEAVPSVSLDTRPQGLRISVGGHLNRSVNFTDDGRNTTTYFVDNGNVPTYAYLKAHKPFSDDLTIGAHIEYSLQSNPATLASQDNRSAGYTTSGRFFEITADSKRYGKLYLGQGISSTYFLAELDKSGTVPFNMLSTGGAFGGVKFVNRETGALSDVTVLQAFLDLEAINLLGRVRYDTPLWNGFQVGANLGEGGYTAGSLRWRGDAGPFDVFAAVSAQKNPQGGRIDERIDGGVGLLHRASGFNLSVGGVSQEFKRELTEVDPHSEGYTVRLGWRRDWNDLGETRIALDFQEADAVTTEEDTVKTTGLFVSQEFRSLNAETYIGYRRYQVDRPDLPLHDIDAFSLGARILFDATFRVNPSR